MQMKHVRITELAFLAELNTKKMLTRAKVTHSSGSKHIDLEESKLLESGLGTFRLATL